MHHTREVSGDVVVRAALICKLLVQVLGAPVTSTPTDQTADDDEQQQQYKRGNPCDQAVPERRVVPQGVFILQEADMRLQVPDFHLFKATEYTVSNLNSTFKN